MGFLDRVLGNDHERAAKYDAPSASESAAQSRRAGHRNGGARRAARAGQAWEDNDRDRETGRRRPR
ncbi:hypothetical protein [Streptomyces sp. NPDC001422]|uniref:hypothetical protein n=1 Tax=Streptomyces sp. NPDC001422 TaxID=3364575 RepID=UPI0036B88634